MRMFKEVHNFFLIPDIISHVVSYLFNLLDTNFCYLVLDKKL